MKKKRNLLRVCAVKSRRKLKLKMRYFKKHLKEVNWSCSKISKT